MKKLPVVLLASLLALAGCSSPAPNPGGSNNALDFQACMVVPMRSQDDGAIASVARAGLDKASKDLGIKTQAEEVTDLQQSGGVVDKFISDKCQIILGTGAGELELFMEKAQANPALYFVIVDAQVPAEKQAQIPNLKSLTFNTAEGAYLAGYLAAGTTITGKVATFGSKEIPDAEAIMTGFSYGVMRYNADNGTAVSSNWNPTERKGMLADSLTKEQVAEQTKKVLSEGADIVMPVAGLNNAGALPEINGNNAVIWVGIDGYESNKDGESAKFVMTSVLKNANTAVEQVIKDVKGNRVSDFSTPWVGDLANGGVALAKFNEFEKRVPTELVNQMATLSEQIKTGDIQVIPGKSKDK